MNPAVYIAGPVTKGNRSWNYYQACEAEKQLMRRGVAPNNPMRSMVLPDAWTGEFSHEDWLAACLPWVARADMLLRLPGESEGAECEVDHATTFGIRVLRVEKWEPGWDYISECAHYCAAEKGNYA